MLAFLFLPVYAAVNAYIIVAIFRWLAPIHGFFKRKVFRIPFIIVYSLLALSMVIAFYMPRTELRRVIKLISNYWLGMFLYIILFFALAHLGIAIYRRIKHRKDLTGGEHTVLGIAVFLVIVSMCTYGVINANIVKERDYSITVEKSAGDIGELDVVLVGDLHLGYNVGCALMEQMVEKINATQPDIVCIAGDIFDNEYEALDDPERLIEILSGIRSKYGVYACYGNHDVDEPILAGFTFDYKKPKLNDPRMDDLVARAGITLLRDESVLVEDSFYIVGRRDEHRPGNGEHARLSAQELTAGIDKSKPVIMLDHEPNGLSDIAESGVDIDLCGHTHAGQIFPLTIATALMSENAWGYKSVDGMHSITTSGVGVFGPCMRTFTDSEIVLLTVGFEG